MSDFLTTDTQAQSIVQLRVKPFDHKAMPTITGSAFSKEAGTVLFGNYTMEYLLPGNDRLRLIANHNQKTVQVLLFTHNHELIQLLPGDRDSSLVADIINKINRYRIRSASYKQPLSPEQQQKLQLANQCIVSLTQLLKPERRLKPDDHVGREALRREVLSIIEVCRDGNRMIANNPIVSEGKFGTMLYDAYKAAQHYHFNSVHSVSRQDQMNFSKAHKGRSEQQSPPCLVWDSEIHIGHNNHDLDDALRVICQHYQLTPPQDLTNVPANRFSRLETYLRSLWLDGQDWINYLAKGTKPSPQISVETRSDGVSITKITPYYKLNGLAQQGYESLNELVSNLTESAIEPVQATSVKKAQKLLAPLANGSWAIIASKQQIILRLDDKLVSVHYFVNDKMFYPLPDGGDLYTLSQVSKRHLYLPERASLRFKAFASRVPTFFQNFYKSIAKFIVNDLHREFFNYVHATHEKTEENKQHQIQADKSKRTKTSLHEALENNGLLANGQTLEEFIKEQLDKSPYVIARSNHPPSPHPYDNPLHRALGVVRHLGSFFIDTSERNPIIGTLAMAAYCYGAGAVLAPNALAGLLTKLHLSGLIAGIEPVQKMAHFMSHGTTSEAISASVTLWQGMVAGGNLDNFFVDAVSILKEDPAGIAIIAALALSLGYGLTKVIPSLQQEMGDFPYTNYAALGGKGGAAIYDTIMHPGDDWLLGTCKWFLKGLITLCKLSVAPLFEGYYYGYQNGFVNGWKKSWALAKHTGKQFIAATADLLLALLTVPLIEMSALLIHVPFRGITNFFRKILATLGNLTAIGGILIEIAERPSTSNFISEFQFSPLYGFTSPLGEFSKNPLFNLGINIARVLFLPPLQLIKNVVILPIIDVLSLTVRLGLTVINPVSRITAYSLGNILYSVGQVWDNSIGLLFSYSAKGLTLCCNGIDNLAGELKQNTLSLIEIYRSKLYHWAFHDEDLRSHTTLTDHQYFKVEPRRYELMPHTANNCLYDNLLHQQGPHSHHEAPPSEAAYRKLFVIPSDRITSPANAEVSLPISSPTIK